MSEIPEFTTVWALDQLHMQEARLTIPINLKARPELAASRKLFMCDTANINMEWYIGEIRTLCSNHKLCDHSTIEFAAWPWRPDLPQRERMLTALVRAVEWVDTPWMLKIDTDTIATQCGPWINPAWLDGNPAFVAPPWGYTKPANAIQRLDDWGDSHPQLEAEPRLDIPFHPQSTRVVHKRIISYLSFINVQWGKWASSLVPRDERLPIPSQDTYHWYVAARARDWRWRTVRFAKCGWAHVRPKALKDIAGKVIRENGICLPLPT